LERSGRSGPPHLRRGRRRRPAIRGARAGKETDTDGQERRAEDRAGVSPQNGSRVAAGFLTGNGRLRNRPPHV
jgi:hypothetical protein